MGIVRDEEAFSKIGELLGELLEYEDPMDGLEAVYPKLADYGYVLYDNYIKILLMFISIRGTRRSFS
jgi:hypothetical protein